MSDYSDRIKEAAFKIRQAQHLVAFTGAGISVESGIPTFRGEGGLWSHIDTKYFEIDYFRMHPDECWPIFAEIFYHQMQEVRPNAAHQVLARWEHQGLLKAVITQNIDNLHQEAGSRRVIEYHGNIRTLECMTCGSRKIASTDVLKVLPPQCTCGGIYKPSFVFFGEAIPQQAAADASHEASSCDVMLVIGTTGSVIPANMIPIYASQSGAYIIIINPEPGEFSPGIVNLYLPLKASEALIAIDNFLNQSAG